MVRWGRWDFWVRKAARDGNISVALENLKWGSGKSRVAYDFGDSASGGELRGQMLEPRGTLRMYNAPPMVGSLFSWKSLLTKRRTRDDWNAQQVH